MPEIYTINNSIFQMFLVKFWTFIAKSFGIISGKLHLKQLTFSYSVVKLGYSFFLVHAVYVILIGSTSTQIYDVLIAISLLILVRSSRPRGWQNAP